MSDDDDIPIKTGPASQAYRDNWERVFGEKEPEDEPQVLLPGHIDNTGMLCRNSSKRVPISHLDHDACDTCNEFVRVATTPHPMYEE